MISYPVFSSSFPEQISKHSKIKIHLPEKRKLGGACDVVNKQTGYIFMFSVGCCLFIIFPVYQHSHINSFSALKKYFISYFPL